MIFRLGIFSARRGRKEAFLTISYETVDVSSKNRMMHKKALIRYPGKAKERVGISSPGTKSRLPAIQTTKSCLITNIDSGTRLTVFREDDAIFLTSVAKAI
jgi:hypothetical protein